MPHIYVYFRKFGKKSVGPILSSSVDCTINGTIGVKCVSLFKELACCNDIASESDNCNHVTTRFETGMRIFEFGC